MGSKTIAVLVTVLVLSSSIGYCQGLILCYSFPWLCDWYPWQKPWVPPPPSPQHSPPYIWSPPPSSNAPLTSPPKRLPPPSPWPVPPLPPADAGRTTFNVLYFGAKGDGKTDDTAAFGSAWDAACQVESSTVLVPEGHEFFIRSVKFDGQHCRGNIAFQVDGKIVAPKNRAVWDSDWSNWIMFSRATGISVQGKGTLEGRGSNWWHSDDLTGTEVAETEHEILVAAKAWDDKKLVALTIYRSNFATLTGITIQNTPNFHVKIMNCERVHVYNLTLSSPGDSSNTDGIQVHRSKHVVIHNTTIACGDDCIAIQKGCRNVIVYDVNCGPGHGISIGSLGKDYSRDCVSDIRVRDIDMHDTINGARIKTWQGGTGCVQGVTFSDIRMTRVRYPIIVDQYYCDIPFPRTCRNESLNVAVSGITYENIRGTYTDTPISFLCSDSVPCTNITLNGVDLKPENNQHHNHDLDRHHHHHHQQHDKHSRCWQVYGDWLSKPSNAHCDVQSGRPSTYGNVRHNMNLCY